MVLRIALWAPLLVAALLVGGYIYAHDPFARDGTELLQVPLSQEDPDLDRVGELKYLGGLDIPRMGQNVGGLSGLRWDAHSERLLAITDDARWVWITLAEDNTGRLAGIAGVESGALLGVDGKPLEGKEQGDSESLVFDSETGWAVGFERDHRIMSYHLGLDKTPAKTDFDVEEALGPLDANNGLEAFAVGSGAQLICAEREAMRDQTNCLLFDYATDKYSALPVTPPGKLANLGSVPTDADALSDGTFLVLFRSYSPAQGNTAAIVAYAPDGTRREIATFLPPLTLDNFEGLAVREEGGGDEKRTFLYIVSDDNFSGSQRTLLMKFEMIPMSGD